mgnify:CR=1 FL=1
MADAPKKKILVVDDEAVVIDFLERLLAREGFEVLTAGDGQQGFDVLEKHPDVSLILLDLMMPELDGTGMLDMLQVLQNPPPVIVLTAVSTSEQVERAIAAGAHDYITKPFEKEQLLEKIASVLDIKNEQRARRGAHRRIVTLKASIAIDVEDISETGLRFKTSFALERGAVVFFMSPQMEVRLDLPSNTRIAIRVAHCQGSGNQFHIGGTFVALSPEVARKIRHANLTGAWWK